MKKLVLTSIAVFIALCGFIAILCFLPGQDCCGKKDGCEMHGKHSGGDGDCKHDGKCDHEKGSCKNGHHSGMGNEDACGMKSGHGECEMKDGGAGCKSGHEKRIVKDWTDADGKVHHEEQVMITGDGKGDAFGSCPMTMGDHSGCCGCCRMKNGMGHSHGNDSMQMDSVRVKVRGKL